MESLASSFKQLTSDKGQSELEPPKADASVAASRSSSTPSAPEANMPQPEGQQQSWQLANPVSPSLETLPVEIQTEILAGATTLQSLRALVHASPPFHHVYSHNRLSILKKTLEHTLDGVLVDAHAAYQSGAPDVRFSFGDYQERLLTVSTEPTLEGLSLAEATQMASFHLSVVEPLTDRYASWALCALSSSPKAVPLSKTEKARIQRAMYRLQIICNMQLWDPARLIDALSSFTPWEAEEILCVHAFATERYSSVFFMTAWDLNQEENPKYRSISILDVNESLLLYQGGCKSCYFPKNNLSYA